MSENTSRLCLNLREVREKMRNKGFTKKSLSKEIGMKDYHTLTYYFEHPDKIRLNHVTAIAAVLGSSPYQYDEFVIRINSDEEFNSLVAAGRS